MSQVKAAGNPAPRTIPVKIADGNYAGWECVAKADFKARRIADLTSGDFTRILDALNVIIVSHNFPDQDTGEHAEDLGEVDFRGLSAVIEQMTEALSSLPNR